MIGDLFEKIGAIVIMLTITICVVFAGFVFAQETKADTNSRFQYEGSYWANKYGGTNGPFVEVVATCDTMTGALIYTTYNGGQGDSIAVLPSGCTKQ